MQPAFLFKRRECASTSAECAKMPEFTVDSCVAMYDPLVYLNGAMTPLSEAKIPVLDRGFIFGDGVYEVIPVYGRDMFRAEQHLARLFRCLYAVCMPNPHDKARWLGGSGRGGGARPAAGQRGDL